MQGMRAAWLIACVACGTNHPAAVSDPTSCDHVQTGSTCCESQGDCPQGFCAPPGGTGVTCGGACDMTPANCASDPDCTGTDVCDPIPCSCFGGSKCVPACDDASC